MSSEIRRMRCSEPAAPGRGNGMRKRPHTSDAGSCFSVARWTTARCGTSGGRSDRKSTRLNFQSRQYLVCRLLLEKKKNNEGRDVLRLCFGQGVLAAVLHSY